jgi:hypothetical protein
MLFSRLGTIGLSVIQASLEADAMVDNHAIRAGSKKETVIVLFEPQAPITALDIRNGLVTAHRYSDSPVSSSASVPRLT